MVLTNAERQARFRRRLRQRALMGVTPEMVVKAARLNFDAWVKDDGAFEREPLSWENNLSNARKRGKADLWRQWIPADREYEYEEFGNDAPMMRAVAQVAIAILYPPDAD